MSEFHAENMQKAGYQLYYKFKNLQISCPIFNHEWGTFATDNPDNPGAEESQSNALQKLI